MIHCEKSVGKTDAIGTTNIVCKSKNKRKIAFLIPNMCGGGAERVVATLSNAFADAGYDIRVITITDGECFYPLDSRVTYKAANLKVNRKNRLTKFFSQTSISLKGLKFIDKQIQEFNPDVVVVFLIKTSFMMYLLKLLGCKVKVIFSERSDPFARGKVMQFLLKTIYKKAEYFVCQGKKVADFYSYIPKDRLVIIPNPINIQAIPKELPIYRRKAIVTVGHLDANKNHELLINSFADIKKSFPEYVLEIYGEGAMRKTLQSQIDKLGLSECITLMGARKDVLERIAETELFVLPTRYEGFPNVLIEAMAVGLPVISTDFRTGIARDLIGPNNGLIVPMDDRWELSSAMKELLLDSEKRRIMSENNRQITEMLSISKVAEEWKRLIESCCGG